VDTDSIVIYYSQKAETRRVAKLIAEKTDSALFDIMGKKEPPDLRKYRFYYVGFPIVNKKIAPVMQSFLSKTDFFDGLVIPFWIGDNGAVTGGDYGELVEKLLYRPRVLGEQSVVGALGNGDPREGQVDAWLAAVTARLDVLRGVGERAEAVMKAFAAAYPERLGEAVLRNGDWAAEMDGEWYYYARGKFLRESETARADDFRTQMVYRYTPEFTGAASDSWKTLAAKLFWRRRVFTDADTYGRSNSGAARSGFYEKLLRVETRADAFAHQKIITFLGRSVTAHELLAAPLARVEERINELEKTDGASGREITAWKKTLDSISAWNWRNVAGSSRLSFHAYGTAIDLLMKPERGKETYWLWTQAKGIDWHGVPEKDKQNPPRSVIGIFEEEGFIWGGKWPWYDTMHFEYHPELILLSFSL
jgi:hypothetical protein